MDCYPKFFVKLDRLGVAENYVVIINCELIRVERVN